MRTYEYDYTISKDNSPSEFKRICALISEGFSDFISEPLLIDVDGSTIQVFAKGNTEIVVYDDYDIGAVFIKSDVNLESVIRKQKVA